MSGAQSFPEKALSHACKLWRRAKNHRHSHDYRPTSPLLVRSSESVLGDEDTGTLFDPHVLVDGGRFVMYVSRRRDASVVRYVSGDGVSWSVPCVSLRPSPSPTDWDAAVNRACVLHTVSGWLMWFTGQQGGTSSIGLARSSDGLVFERVQDTPVLVAGLPHEGGSVMNPCVLPEENCGFRMWYAAGEDYEPDVICEARSDDGVVWTKKPKPVLCKGSEPYDSFKVGGCSVVRLSQTELAMFYIGYQNLDVARVCLALSFNDGETWERSLANPLLGPKRGSWDSDAVYKPSALVDDGHLRIWYNGRSGRRELIGYAQTDNLGGMFAR